MGFQNLILPLGTFRLEKGKGDGERKEKTIMKLCKDSSSSSAPVKHIFCSEKKHIGIHDISVLEPGTYLEFSSTKLRQNCVQAFSLSDSLYENFCSPQTFSPAPAVLPSEH